MIVAIPISEGKLFPHFGHCAAFAMIEVDQAAKKILGRSDVAAPPHQPGLLPGWLAERGVKLVIAGGLGGRALDLLTQNGIETVVGAPVETPEKLVTDYLAGTLSSGANACDH